jgi:hypothetical protein
MAPNRRPRGVLFVGLQPTVTSAPFGNVEVALEALE